MKRKKQTLLWRISGPELPGDSFLFGTMHVRDQRAFRLREAVQGYIRTCEGFAAEFNLEESLLFFDPKLLQLPQSFSLSGLIPPGKYGKLKRMLKKSFRIELDQFRNKLPVIVTHLIDETVLAQDMSHALDEDLWRYARQEGKTLLGLETYGEQMEILHQIPFELQVKALLAIGKNVRRHRRQLHLMAHLYEKADLSGLYQASRRGAGHLRGLMLYRRNEVMARRLAGLVRKQTVFAAIGAGHLGGGKGMLRLLKNHGFQVKPMTGEKMALDRKREEMEKNQGQ